MFKELKQQIRLLMWCRMFYGVHVVQFIRFNEKKGHCPLCGKRTSKDPGIYGDNVCRKCEVRLLGHSVASTHV